MLKQSASDLLLKSIRKVHDGEIWLDNRITAEVIDRSRNPPERAFVPERRLAVLETCKTDTFGEPRGRAAGEAQALMTTT